MACNYCGIRFAALVALPSASGKDLNSVDLPDSRIQHLNYLPIDLDGYVGEVTDEGSAVYPEAIPCCRILSMGELDNGQLDIGGNLRICCPYFGGDGGGDPEKLLDLGGHTLITL